MVIRKYSRPIEKIVYMDNNATTRADPLVAEVMVHYLTEEYGNSESVHHFGGDLRYVEDDARENVTRLFNGNPANLYFTSGATEANNWALRGVMKRAKGKHIITSTVEHPSVLNVCKQLELDGYQVTYLPVTMEGVVELDALIASVREDTSLVSIMYANNETGAIMPIADIGNYLKDKKIIFHSDATQALGKISLDVVAEHIDLLSFSAHKFHGPKGIGGLHIAPRKRIAEGAPWRIEITPFILGGEQQDYMRGGTMNIPSIAGLGKAAELAYLHSGDSNQVEKLRNLLEQSISEQVPGVIINSQNARRLPNTTNIIFPGAEGESIVDRLSEIGICVSTGSACSSKSLTISHVLDAMKVEPSCINSVIRFSLSRYTSEEEIKYVIHNLPKIIEKLRNYSGYTRKRGG